MPQDTGLNVILMVTEHAPVQAAALREEAGQLRTRADEFEKRAMVLEQLMTIAAPYAPQRPQLGVAA